MTHSYLKADIVQNQRVRITGWRGTDHDLLVYVHEINTSASPGYADIEITFDGPAVTPAPTPNPTPNVSWTLLINVV